MKLKELAARLELELRGDGETEILAPAPIEAAGINYCPAHRDAMPAHELGERMDYDIGAVFDRPQKDGRRNGVVYNQRQSM